jgi:type IV pilus assembly protein PilA
VTIFVSRLTRLVHTHRRTRDSRTEQRRCAVTTRNAERPLLSGNILKVDTMSNRPRSNSRPRPAFIALAAKRGFTLIELMIVVAILGVLSSIAIVSFRKYTRRARTTEAYNMLGMIRMRQEAYRSEFSQYANVSGSIASMWPATVGVTAQDWYSGVPAGWTQLGVRPTGQVYYQYATIAGLPPAVPSVAGAAPADLGYSTLPSQDAWWVAHAKGDLDGDGVQSLFETASFTNSVYAEREVE